MVASGGFEPSNAEQSDLQSDPFGRLGNSPGRPRAGVVTHPSALNKNSATFALEMSLCRLRPTK